MKEKSKSKIVLRDAYGQKIYTAYVSDPAFGLRGAVLEGFHAPFAKLQGIDFSGCIMYWASLEGADLSFCLFHGAEMRGATLDKAILRYADLTKANLGADAFGKSASLVGADLSYAKTDNANFIGVTYNDDTIFPDGFSADMAGLIKIERA